MSPDMQKFLRVLAERGRPIPPRKIGIGCTVAQGKARQAARGLGYVTFDATAGMWAITQAGLEALEKAQGFLL
ncbi:hypothetical protein [Methylobacterium oxalidis]|uniref:Transcriptional regulator n=1 Tax=Methylobacterium oxalidis TaxID=944322 RepID=A0A512J946_9HYPH|nr:hypothetical protein [Methylobacterium oxalidis]GEP06494.1 hypothetical protein MOX02_45320 [Methylobacterium oxalidis]GJE30694.1 hypothetical protein LDDCCGHA_0863 [Methylobacterium oxalidis]GLS63928.1 hypothetical protein GCM10007888_23090 [Methylobacterium oxalidis]